MPPQEKGPQVHLTPSLIAEFRTALLDKGYNEDTVSRYCTNLTRLLNDLPEDKCIRKGTLARWQEDLLEAGYAARTVNLFVSPANSLLEYLNLRELQLATQLKPEAELQPELTRTEYLRLLQTARATGKERVYLLVKLFATTGLPVQELTKVTVEAAETGKITTVSSGIKQIVRVPECLQKELLSYAKRNGLRSGPIFRTRDGAPMSRTNVTTGIRQLCAAAQVPVEKGNPRCLKRLYQATKAGIEANVALLVEQAQERMMEQEQLAIGWTDGE
ncbi:hypothetical protein CE91St41_13630 [Oscillospiraceae bacterium]|nr:hypothetical protein CE91St40_23910 [Oscillospiraceae bacterium]BDF74474.1 hypothetical protein CE91St41_13630 [Oscillospiraceae bacterium]